MTLTCLHSRAALGSDIVRAKCDVSNEFEETSSLGGQWIEMQQVRVVLGKWGDLVRLSAPELDMTTDGIDFNEAWDKFLHLVTQLQNSSWLTFDVGPLRDNEISEALNAPEDERWNETSNEGEE